MEEKFDLEMQQVELKSKWTKENDGLRTLLEESLTLTNPQQDKSVK